LKGETLTVMNLVWDLTSDILVTITGTVMFGEKISFRKWMGVGLAFVSLLLLSTE
jgi:multidrug transporter EmrE-like cation transporter